MKLLYFLPFLILSCSENKTAKEIGLENCINRTKQNLSDIDKKSFELIDYIIISPKNSKLEYLEGSKAKFTIDGIYKTNSIERGILFCDCDENGKLTK